MSSSGSYQSGEAAYVPIQTNDSAQAPAPRNIQMVGDTPSTSARTVAIFVVTLVVVCFTIASVSRSTPSSAKPTMSVSVETPVVDVKKNQEKQLEKQLEKMEKTICADKNFSSQTLKLAHEMPVIALLGHPEQAPVFETSCILNIGDFFYVVSDDTPSIGKIRTNLQYDDPLNTLIPPSKPLTEGASAEQGFEALFYDEKTETFSAVIEALPLKGSAEEGRYHSIIYDLKIRPDGTAYDVIGECPSNFEFTSANKGFEGAALVRNTKGDEYVLGLCEGNYCEGGDRGRSPGNGRVVVLLRSKDLDIHGTKWACAFSVVQVIELPKSVFFRDYSAITMYGSDPSHLRVAIASQENSQVWIGHFNADKMKFSTQEERVYDFPRNDDCEIVYCNVEGLDFLADNLLVAASDQMKNLGRQSSRCLAKDQSIHVFVIP